MNKDKVVKSVVTFISLSYIFMSFVFYVVLKGKIPDFTQPLDFWKIILIMSTPALSSCITARIFKEKYLTKNEIWGFLNRWHLIALFLPIVLMMLSSFFSLILYSKLSFNSQLTGAIEFNKDLPIDLKYRMLDQMSDSPLANLFGMTLSGLSQAWSLSMLLALGEELGWRGYLLKKLEPFGFWTSVFVIGPVWGLWHYPLILKGYNYPSNPKLGVLMMMVACTAITPIMIYITKKSKSVWAAAIFHGSFNSFTAFAFLPIHGETTTFETGFLGLSRVLACLFCFLIFILLEKAQTNLKYFV